MVIFMGEEVPSRLVDFDGVTWITLWYRVPFTPEIMWISEKKERVKRVRT